MTRRLRGTPRAFETHVCPSSSECLPLI
jgi:hypothetical protein